MLATVDSCNSSNIVQCTHKYVGIALNKYNSVPFIYQVYIFGMPCSCIIIIYSYIIFFDGNGCSFPYCRCRGLSLNSVKIGTSFLMNYDDISYNLLLFTSVSAPVCVPWCMCRCRCVIYMHDKNKEPTDLCSFTSVCLFHR